MADNHGRGSHGPKRIATLDLGASLILPCGCTGKRWGERRGLIWVSVARACPLHDIAMYDGLSVLPSTPVRLSEDDASPRVGLRVVRDPTRPRVIVEAEEDGTTLAHCQRLAHQRVTDGTWRMATLVEAGAFVPSPADAWLLAEFVASAVQVHGPRGPMAVVTPGTAEFEIASAYHRHFAGLAPPAFRTRDDAAAWLHSQGY
jgi:hypothetical protein